MSFYHLVFGKSPDISLEQWMKNQGYTQSGHTLAIHEIRTTKYTLTNSGELEEASADDLAQVAIIHDDHGLVGAFSINSMKSTPLNSQYSYFPINEDHILVFTRKTPYRFILLQKITE